jgi:hypothetical protein
VCNSYLEFDNVARICRLMRGFYGVPSKHWIPFLSGQTQLGLKISFGFVRQGLVAKILQFVRAETPAFDEYPSCAMGEAFASACAELHDRNLSKLFCEIIAERIIEAVKRGERDPKRLCSIAIATIGRG